MIHEIHAHLRPAAQQRPDTKATHETRLSELFGDNKVIGVTSIWKHMPTLILNLWKLLTLA